MTDLSKKTIVDGRVWALPPNKKQNNKEAII